MRSRLLAAAAAGAVLTALAVAGPATAGPAVSSDIVGLPVSFAVHNTNRTSVVCSSDGADYTVRGTMVGPRDAVERADAATLYLHAVTWGEYYWRFPGVPGYDVAHLLAEQGHVSVAVDRLGYGDSDKPAGDATCFGSEADVAHQMVQALRTGDYEVDGAEAVGFGKVFTGGSSVGGMIANIEAFTFGDVDGLMNFSWGDFAASPYAGSEVLDASRRCVSGGDPGTPGYAVFAKSTKDTFYFHSATPEVRAATPPLSSDPCGQLLSLSAGIAADGLDLSKIDVPVLVMFGDADAVFPPPAATQQALRYSGSPEVRSVNIPGASHYPFIEANHLDAVGAVDTWLDDHSG
jgi:Lysophospholipase